MNKFGNLIITEIIQVGEIQYEFNLKFQKRVALASQRWQTK